MDESSRSNFNGYLIYVIQNCKIAFEELCSVNKELRCAMSSESERDVNRLGALNRMIQDYLVVRVAGLFDKDTRTISLLREFPESKRLVEVKEEKIIQRLIRNRHQFVAHSDREYIEAEDFIIPTHDICSSNLGKLLEVLETFVKNIDGN